MIFHIMDTFPYSLCFVRSRRRERLSPIGLTLSLVLVSLLTGCGTFSTLPKAYQPTDPLEPHQFSHQAIDGILRAHVQDGVVNYPGIATDPRLEAYLREVNRLDPTTLPTQKDRLAFWINVYNAFAIKGILDGYSPKTKFGQYTYFVGQDYMVGGAEVNLWSVERDILIPRFREPRIHFAIVCASRSCPKLRSWAFTPGQLDDQLNDSARKFINDPTKNFFDRDQKIAYLSMIFNWFEEDFVGHSGSLLKYVKQYVDNPDLARELSDETYSIKFLEYDWSLNGMPPPRHASLGNGMEKLAALRTAESKTAGYIEMNKVFDKNPAPAITSNSEGLDP